MVRRRPGPPTAPAVRRRRVVQLRHQVLHLFLTRHKHQNVAARLLGGGVNIPHISWVDFAGQRLARQSRARRAARTLTLVWMSMTVLRAAST